MNADTIQVLVQLASGVIVPIVKARYDAVRVFAEQQGADDQQLARLATLWDQGLSEVKRDARPPDPAPQ